MNQICVDVGYIETVSKSSLEGRGGREDIIPQKKEDEREIGKRTENFI